MGEDVGGEGDLKQPNLPPQSVICPTAWVVGLFCLAFLSRAAAADGVFVRFQLVEPADAPWFLKLNGKAPRA